MRRIATTLALALCLLGCGSEVLPWDRVDLLTNTGNPPSPYCYTAAFGGPLIVDRTYGTAITDPEGSIGPVPVMWPVGFTGRRVGSEVEVLDLDGMVVATTGRTYEIRGGFEGREPRVWLYCGGVFERALCLPGCSSEPVRAPPRDEDDPVDRGDPIAPRSRE
jgi:hypothetical protein